MIEVYSLNTTVATNAVVPLSSTTIQKGCTTTLSGNTISLNKCGVYMVSVDASAATSGTAGNITIELTKDGVLQPQAQSTFYSGATTDIGNLSFVTLVQVTDSNSCRCCDAATTIQVLNTGEAATFTNINVVVTKVC